jgi:hypothetical protein
LLGHIAKQNLGRSNAASLSMRGGSAFEADALQVLYLVKEGDTRYLVRGKTRFEAKWTELEIESHSSSILAPDEYGDMETVTLRWGIAQPPQLSRKQVKWQHQEQAKIDDQASLRGAIRDAVQTAWITGLPLNRQGIKAKIKRKTQDVTPVKAH